MEVSRSGSNFEAEKTQCLPDILRRSSGHFGHDLERFLEGFVDIFGRLLEPFWELKGLQKSSQFLDAFLEARKDRRPVIWDPPGEMRGLVGEDLGGGAESQENQEIRNSACVSRTPSQVGRRIAPFRQAVVTST